MPRPEGIPKTGGRKKGTPNLRSIELADQLARAGLDVPTEVAKTLSTLDAEVRAKVLMELMTFLYPKRKAIEHSGQIVADPVQEVHHDKPKSAEERRKDLTSIIKKLIECDNEFTMVMVEAIVRRKTALTLPAQAVALLESTFRPK